MVEKKRKTHTVARTRKRRGEERRGEERRGEEREENEQQGQYQIRWDKDEIDWRKRKEKNREMEDKKNKESLSGKREKKGEKKGDQRFAYQVIEDHCPIIKGDIIATELSTT